MIEEAEIETSRQNQPVWQTIDAQVAKSRLTRTPRFSPECELTIEGRKYTIERVVNNESGEISRIYRLLTNNFQQEEVEPEDVLTARIQVQPVPEQKYKHRAFAIKDEGGEMVSGFVGVHLDLRDDLGKPTGETVYAIGYIATNGSKRFNDLARETYMSSLIDAGLQAEGWGKKLKLAIGECTAPSEPFWNAVGLKRMYLQKGPKIYQEIPYLQPPHEFNPDTGMIAEGAGAVPEHLMVQKFGPGALTKEKLIQAVVATYRELYIQPQELFTNDEAYQKHLSYVANIADDFKKAVFESGQLIFLDEANRTKAIRAGIEVHDYMFPKT